MPPQLPKPVNRQSHEPKQRKPWNRLPDETQAKVREMIRAGEQLVDICRVLKLGKGAVQRIAAEVRQTGTAAPRSQPTKICTGTLNCQCVYHLAEAYKRSNRKPARFAGE